MVKFPQSVDNILCLFTYF